MVAVIKTGASIQRIFTYNEQKVKEGVAQCIWAANYPKDVDCLTLQNKLNRLLNQAALNENVTRNSVHISLNFDPSENLSCDQLRSISDAYMQKIGFGGQPYLVYQHLDAGHPHLHIVSIKIKSEGSRIDTQNIGRNQSQKARKEIERAFGLVRAEEMKLRRSNAQEPVFAESVQYGKRETKRAISSVLKWVVHNYKYTSLAEFNAVLKQYNVVADRGSEKSRIHQNNGLVYRILDAHGNKKGVPIKASECEDKPTLRFLQEKFLQNETARQQHKTRVKNTIDLAFFKERNFSLQSLEKSLQKEGISTVLSQNTSGAIQEIIYVDHQTQCVFNGLDLGKQYSALGIQDRCRQAEKLHPTQAISDDYLSQQSQIKNKKQKHISNHL